jgi:hypothetical protein
MFCDDDISVEQKFKNEKDRLLSLISEIEADDTPYMKPHSLVDVEDEVMNSVPAPSRARCMKRRSIWGDQVLETAPDQNNNPINVFDSVQDPVLEQLTTDLTSQIIRQQNELDVLRAKLATAEGQLKTSCAWKNTTTSYCNLLLNELGNGKTSWNVLNQLCVCLADHIGTPRVAVGNFPEPSEKETRVGAPVALEPVDQLSIKNLFIVASNNTEDSLYRTFELFTRRGDGKAGSGRGGQLFPSRGEDGDAARLSRKNFYLLCFVLDLFNTR